MISEKLVVILLSICVYTSVSAAAYRWVDEQGRTVYSQNPPPSSGAVRIKMQPAPGTEAANEVENRLRRQREQAFDEEEARKETETKQAKQAADEANRTKNCAAARENLKKYRTLGPRMIRTPDGRYLRLSEEEVKMQIEKARRQVGTYCN